PSGADLATSSEPTTPPAPPRFSTMNVSLKVSPSLLATRRPSVSAVSPGAKGAAAPAGLDGPPAANGAAAGAAAGSTAIVVRKRMGIGILTEAARYNTLLHRGTHHGNDRRAAYPRVAGQSLAWTERSPGAQGLHRGMRVDRESVRQRIQGRHRRRGRAGEGEVRRQARALRPQPAEFLLALLRRIGRRRGIRQGRRAGVAEERRRGDSPVVFSQGERRRKARAGRIAADRRRGEENGGRFLRGVQREAGGKRAREIRRRRRPGRREDE